MVGSGSANMPASENTQVSRGTVSGDQKPSGETRTMCSNRPESGASTPRAAGEAGYSRCGAYRGNLSVRVALVALLDRQ